MQTTTTISDGELILLLQNQRTQNQGFRVLVKQYQERIYWHIRRMVVDHEDANDVVQNTFIKAFRGIHNFKGNSKLYTWLYRIATNESITFLNKRKRQSAESLDHPESATAAQLKAESYVDSTTIQQRLAKAIEQLPDKQKAVFLMRYYDEMSYKDMAASLGTSVGALKASYHHAVKKIEKFIRQD